MIQMSKRVQVLVGAAIGMNLLLGAAAAAGVVPRPVHTEDVAAARPAAATLDVTHAVEASAAAGTTTVPPETTVPTTAPPTTAAKVTASAAAPVAAAAAAPAPVVEAPAPTTPPVTQAPQPKTAARVNPSSEQVMAAVNQIRTRIPLLPQNEAYARQFGDAVCTAFDQGNSASQVRAQVLQAVSQIPLIKVQPADADFAIKTAVNLFCPGYASKLA